MEQLLARQLSFVRSSFMHTGWELPGAALSPRASPLMWCTVLIRFVGPCTRTFRVEPGNSCCRGLDPGMMMLGAGVEGETDAAELPKHCVGGHWRHLQAYRATMQRDDE